MESRKEEDSFLDILESKRVELVTGLHLERTFIFDYLRSKGVFDGGDCELICVEKTRDKKANKFLEILSTKGRNGFDHFIDGLQLSNPVLFEQVTGEKANAKPNPIMTVLKTGFQEQNYFPDLDILTNHLQRTIAELNDLSLRYQEVRKEKTELEKRLIELELDVDVSHRRIDELERDKAETATDIISSLSSVHSAKDSVVIQMQSLQRDLQERNTYIIALQMNLLSAQEQIVNLKTQLHENEETKQELHNQLNLVTINYDHQRTESMKLSEKLEFHKNDVQKYNDIKLKYRELQFHHQNLKEEKDEVTRELNKLKEWIEVFKTRYDIVEEDCEQTRESHEIIAADCSQLREKVNELELKLRTKTRELDSTKQRYIESEEAVKNLREQRDLLSESRNEIMLERDQAQIERDRSIQRYTEVLKNRDETITRQTAHCKHYEDKYQNACTELQELEGKLSSMEHELEELRKSKLGAESPEHLAQPSRVRLSELNNNKSKSELPLQENATSSSDCSPTDSHDSDDSFDWKMYRKTTNIIESLKKRIGKVERKDGHLPFYGSRSLDRMLEDLVPQKKSLSPEAQKCLSLERNRNIFKVTPTHSSLACMFDSIGTNGSSSMMDPSFPRNSQTNDSQSNKKSSSLPLPPKAMSDSVVYEESLEKKSRKFESIPKGRKAIKKPPFLSSLSSPSGLGSHLALNNNPTCLSFESGNAELCISSEFGSAKKSKEGLSLIERYGVESESEQGPLLSPSLAQPFRPRAMAIRLKENERPRSSSAPASPGVDSSSPISFVSDTDR